MNKFNNWLIFDDVQFIDKEWINRNKIIHSSYFDKTIWFIVPLKSMLNRDINEKYMNILIIGQCTLHWGRMEFGNSGITILLSLSYESFIKFFQIHQ